MNSQQETARDTVGFQRRFSVSSTHSVFKRVAGSTGASRGVVILVVYLTTAFVLTHINIDGTIIDYRNFPSQFRIVDNIYHFTAYAALMFLVLFVYGRPRNAKGQSTNAVSARRVVWLCVLVAAYGVFDEITQPLFQRNLEALDLVANCFGIFFGQILFIALEVSGIRKRLMRLK